MKMKDKIRSNPELWESLSHAPVKCPECGCTSDSVKCYQFPGLCVFLLFYAYVQRKRHIGCPKCIRKKIFQHGFTYNIITGNFFWILMMICQLLRSFTSGHSDEITEILFDDYSNAHNES